MANNFDNETIQDFIADTARNPQEQIALLKAYVAFYKKQREVKNALFDQKDAVEDEVVLLEKKLESVQDLEKIETRLLHEIERFGDIAYDTNLPQKVSTMRASKLSTLMNFMRSLKGTFTSSETLHDQASETVLSPRRSMLPIIMFTVLTGIFGVSSFLLLQNQRVLLLAIGFVLAQLLILFFGMFFSFHTLSSPKNSKDQRTLGLAYSHQTSYRNFVQQLQRSSESFFINAAWVEALYTELGKVRLAMAHRLDGKSILEARSQIEKLRNEMDRIDNELELLLGRMLKADEYLSLRREIDVLLIEHDTLQENVSIPKDISFNIESINSPRLKRQVQGFALEMGL